LIDLIKKDDDNRKFTMEKTQCVDAKIQFKKENPVFSWKVQSRLRKAKEVLLKIELIRSAKCSSKNRAAVP